MLLEEQSRFNFFEFNVLGSIHPLRLLLYLGNSLIHPCRIASLKNIYIYKKQKAKEIPFPKKEILVSQPLTKSSL